MLMPSIFRNDVFDEFFDSFYSPSVRRNPERRYRAMKTDVKELDDRYELAMDLPGYDKDDMKISLKDGYMTVEASHSDSKEEKSEDGRYIRRERYTGAVQRTFYVGDKTTTEDIKAKFENGILFIDVPKDAACGAEEKYITIEG